MNSESRKRRKTVNLGVMLREEHLRSRMQIFDGVMDYCLEQPNLKAFLIPLGKDSAPDPEILGLVDGLVTWALPGDQWIKDLWLSGVPLVNCNNAFLKETPTISPGRTQVLSYQYLKNLGRKNIGHIALTEQDDEYAREMESLRQVAEKDCLRIKTFRGVKTDPGLHPEHLLLGRGEEELERFLKEIPKPASIWCVHDEMAALVWKKAEQLGIRVPDELALFGFGDHPCAVHSTPGITTIKIHGARLGYEAAKLIHGHLSDGAPLDAKTPFFLQPEACVIERLSTGGSNPIHRKIQRAWRLMEEYPEDGLTVEFLIKESKLPRISFYKEFERTFGMPPGKAIRVARTRKAKQHLFSTDLQISQIGRLCGFSGESEFSNFFRRETGKTPMEWRRDARANGTAD